MKITVRAELVEALFFFPEKVRAGLRQAQPERLWASQ
jgi:hypothetical protein